MQMEGRVHCGPAFPRKMDPSHMSILTVLQEAPTGRLSELWMLAGRNLTSDTYNRPPRGRWGGQVRLRHQTSPEGSHTSVQMHDLIWADCSYRQKH